MDAGQQPLGDHAKQDFGKLDPDLILLVGWEDVDDTVGSLGSGVGMERGQHQVAGFSDLQGRFHGFPVTHFPDHDHIWVFVLAFLLVHVVSIVLDPYAKVTLPGALIPGLSEYRSVPVAIGTMALYAFLLTALTARYTKLLPAGIWLKIHRLALLVWVLAWLHGVLAGTDSDALGVFYIATGLAVVVSGSYRYWASRQRRPTFTTSLPEVTR